MIVTLDAPVRCPLRHNPLALRPVRDLPGSRPGRNRARPAVSADDLHPDLGRPRQGPWRESRRLRT